MTFITHLQMCGKLVKHPSCRKEYTQSVLFLFILLLIILSDRQEAHRCLRLPPADTVLLQVSGYLPPYEYNRCK